MQTLVVVGAGPLLGLSVAKKFGQNGFRVALIARRQHVLDEHVNALGRMNIEAAGFAADITRPEEIEAAFRGIEKRFGAVDVLEFSPTDWGKGQDKLTSAKALDTDAVLNDLRLLPLGAITCVRQVLPSMLERKRGTLLFATGYSAIQPLSFIASLGIANSGLRNYVYCLHEDLSPEGIFVGTVSINAHIVPGTDGDPDRIAEVFYRMHVERDPVEKVFGHAAH